MTKTFLFLCVVVSLTFTSSAHTASAYTLDGLIDYLQSMFSLYDQSAIKGSVSTPVTCTCDEPGGGVNHNHFECTDGDSRWCATDEVCYGSSTKPSWPCKKTSSTTTTTQTFCADPDYGMDFLKASTCKDSGGSFSDRCVNDDELEEFYCLLIKCGSIKVSCKYFVGTDYVCSDGRCVKKTTTTTTTQPACDGFLSLGIRPDTVTKGSEVEFIASGLKNCQGKVVSIFEDSLLLSKTCKISNTAGDGCSVKETVNLDPGAYKISATIDKNSDGDASDPGEIANNILVVQSTTTSTTSRTTSTTSKTTSSTTTTTISNCVDSDGGYTIYTKGKCSDKSGSYSDYCDNGVLYEYYCNNDGCVVKNDPPWSHSPSKCPTGYSCSDGRCIETPTTSKTTSTTSKTTSSTSRTTSTTRSTSTTTTRPPTPRCDFSDFQNMASDIINADWSARHVKDNHGNEMDTAKIVYSAERNSYLAVYHIDLGGNNFEVWLAESKDLESWKRLEMLFERSSSQPYVAVIKGMYYVAVEKDFFEKGSNVTINRYPNAKSLVSGQPDREITIQRGFFSSKNFNEGTPSLIDTGQEILLAHHWNDATIERDKQAIGYLDYDLTGVTDRQIVNVDSEQAITGDMGDRDIASTGNDLLILMEGNTQNRGTPNFEKYWKIYAGSVNNGFYNVNSYEVNRLDVENEYGEVGFSNPSFSVIPSPKDKKIAALLFSYFGMTTSGQTLFYYELDSCDYASYYQISNTCSAGETCSSFSADECSDGIWIIKNNGKSKALEHPVIKQISSGYIEFTPADEGKVDAISICFEPQTKIQKGVIDVE